MQWTAENIQWFLSQPAPRQVDENLLRVALDTVFPKFLRVITFLMPFLILAVIGGSFLVRLQTSDLKGEWQLMTESTALAPGKVLSIEKRKGSKGAITYVYEFEFTPQADAQPNSQPVKGICYSSAQVASPGEAVSIEYVPSEPKASRIEGCRLSSGAVFMLIALPFLGAIVGVMPFGLLRYQKKYVNKLLSRGIVTTAHLQSIKPGSKGTLIVQVRYHANGAELMANATVSGRKPDKEWLKAQQESGQPVTILVDPDKAKSVYLLSLLLRAN